MPNNSFNDNENQDNESNHVKSNNFGFNRHNSLSNNGGLPRRFNQNNQIINDGGATGQKNQKAPSFNKENNKKSNGIADNLRKKFNTTTSNNVGDENNEPKNSIKDEAIKKIAKNNPYAQAASRIRDVYRKRKNRKNANNDSSNNEQSDSASENNNENESQNETDDNTSEEKETKLSIKRRIYIKLAIFGLAFFGLYALIMTVASALTGGGVFKVAPISSSKDYGTDSFQSITPEDSKIHKDEIKYYEKIKEAREKNGDVVNMDYVSALLMELFYEYDATYRYDEKKIEELRDSGGIDFAKMTDNIDKFVDLIKEIDSTDYDINGKVYNSLKNSDEFKSYYKEILKNKNADDILTNVFTLAQEIGSAGNYDATVVTDETTVTIIDKKNGNNSNNSTNNSQNKTLSINDYLLGTIYANTNLINDSEKVKAYTIAYSTNIVAQNKSLTISSNNAQITGNVCNVKEGCSYDSSGNLVDGPGERNSQNNTFYNGKYYYKTPLSQEEIKKLSENVGSVFGNVLVTSNGTYANLDASKIDGTGGDDYKKILDNAYNNFALKNVGENSYILDGSFGFTKVLTDVIFYDQGNYSSYSFCGLSRATIKSSGCGVTSMAIVASTYENNKKYDPIYMNNEAKSKGLCGTNGTAQAFFGNEAKSMGYKYIGGSKYDKSFLNLVLKHLSLGHLVVVRIGPSHFTSGGHYMVLGGIDPSTKQVYVYDPNNNSNKGWRKTGNGWYSFNDIIVKEAWNFYIIWKG